MRLGSFKLSTAGVAEFLLGDARTVAPDDQAALSFREIGFPP